MNTIHVNTGKPYDILIDNGLIDKCGELIKAVSKSSRVMIISDSNVFPLYGDNVLTSLEKAGFDVYSFIFKAGEESKNLNTVSQIYNTLAVNEFTRTDLIVALGGGVTGDMAGFAAASYLRGINFVQIPTSLLAQVDSSVGGKTGVDIEQGKNLVGAFWQPILVIIDPNTLNTLSDNFFTDGMGEIIKYGCIKKETLFTQLETCNIKEDIKDIILQCVKIKRDIVQEDEQEQGERILLNFGHTLAHSLEKEYKFKGISHGQAVAIGMVMITKSSEKAGITKPGCANRIANLCQKYGLPIDDPTSASKLSLGAYSDKKTTSNLIRLVVISDIGKSKIHIIEKSKLTDFISIKDTFD